jgi:GH18 family chitinase
MRIKAVEFLLAIGLSMFASATSPALAKNFVNIAYVEINSNYLSNVGCYKLSDSSTPFFDIAVIFAANINGQDQNAPQVFFNTHVDHLLNEIRQVKFLQSREIKVLLTLLGNHQRAGWSGITKPSAAKEFADNIAAIVEKYNLDGIDIDDEYSRYAAKKPSSMIMIAEALKANPKFSGKILSKALFMDDDVFRARYKNHALVDYLDYGWEMTYADFDAQGRLKPYQNYGMAKSSLAIGVSTNNPPALGPTLAELRSSGIRAVMVYNVTKDSASYLSQIANVEYGQQVKADANCLQ